MHAKFKSSCPSMRTCNICTPIGTPLVRLLWWQILSISPEVVCAYLKEQIPFISEGILERFLEHKFDGEVFLQLNYEYLCEIAPLLGDRLNLKKIINKALAESLVSLFLNYSRVISILVHVTCSLETLIDIQPRCNLLPYILFCLSHSLLHVCCYIKMMYMFQKGIVVFLVSNYSITCT